MPQQQQMQQRPEEPIPEPSWSGCQGICLTCIDEGHVGVVQRCGAYQGWAGPGAVWFCPLLHSVTPVSVAIKQMKIDTECKTKDNVTVTVTTAVQFYIERKQVEAAVFIVEDPEAQIR